MNQEVLTQQTLEELREQLPATYRIELFSGDQRHISVLGDNGHLFLVKPYSYPFGLDGMRRLEWNIQHLSWRQSTRPKQYYTYKCVVSVSRKIRQLDVPPTAATPATAPEQREAV